LVVASKSITLASLPASHARGNNRCRAFFANLCHAVAQFTRLYRCDRTRTCSNISSPVRALVISPFNSVLSLRSTRSPPYANPSDAPSYRPLARVALAPRPESFARAFCSPSRRYLGTNAALSRAPRCALAISASSSRARDFSPPSRSRASRASEDVDSDAAHRSRRSRARRRSDDVARTPRVIVCGFALGFASLRDAEMEPGAIALGRVARAPAQPCRVRARSTARGDDDDEGRGDDANGGLTIRHRTRRAP
jgi:hypothetical protein